MTETDPRKILAAEHPELNLDPPPLYRCARPGCVNTVLTDGAFCDFDAEDAQP